MELISIGSKVRKIRNKKFILQEKVMLGKQRRERK